MCHNKIMWQCEGSFRGSQVKADMDSKKPVWLCAVPCLVRGNGWGTSGIEGVGRPRGRLHIWKGVGVGIQHAICLPQVAGKRTTASQGWQGKYYSFGGEVPGASRMRLCESWKVIRYFFLLDCWHIGMKLLWWSTLCLNRVEGGMLWV